VTKQTIQDPFQEREAQKYEKPIPSREYILQCLTESGRLMRREQIAEALAIEDPEQLEGLRRRLRAMERDGQLAFTRRGGYGLPEKMDLIKGRVIGHKDGFGFVVPDDGSSHLFLTPREMRQVFDGDRVLVRVTSLDRKGRREAAIAEVLERNTHKVVCRFFEEHGICFATPESKRITQNILIPAGEQGGARMGQIVMVEITAQPGTRTQAIGRVSEILGEHMAPGMEIDIAIRSHNIPHMWPDDVLTEIKDLREKVTGQDSTGRVDVRGLPLVTIDGEDAKDFDDAVYCEKVGKGWKLFVAIADVSHYVQPDTALDREALQRGNSVYFPGAVVPMLPEILSNGLCSLKPQVDRLCMVCEMKISATGKLQSYQFYEAVMHSHARLTYTEVTLMLQNPKLPSAKRYANLLPHLKNLNSLYEVLRASREVRGAIDFETTETRVIFGAQRKIKQIVPTVRTVAHRIIEECMLMANVAAAQFVLEQKLPALFRIHQGPTAEKLQDVRDFLAELGLRFRNRKEPLPGDYAELLQRIADRPDARLIQTVLLRSLSQAVYSPDNTGHFGLAFDAYAHFTSPIRRYPDLLLHRAIRYAQKKRRKPFVYTHAAMEKLGVHCSVTERRADEATRDVMDWLKCEFMQDKIGEEFDGIITSVTGFGVFVELQEIYVEGLVHVTSLKNDYYHFDLKRHQLRGERSGIIYHLGDRLRVRVAKVDLEQRRMDFDLVTETKKINKNKKEFKKKKRR
jgi:ribonuclease R